MSAPPQAGSGDPIPANPLDPKSQLLADFLLALNEDKTALNVGPAMAAIDRFEAWVRQVAPAADLLAVPEAAPPQAFADPDHDRDKCGCGNHSLWCPFNPDATEVTPYPLDGSWLFRHGDLPRRRTS